MSTHGRVIYGPPRSINWVNDLIVLEIEEDRS